MGGHKVLHFLGGSIFLVWYFRLQGATIGRQVCLYPNAGETMMTEPNLVTLDDGVCVDQASLICHVNSRGVFSLRTLTVGSRSTLRSFSRLLSGATMEKGSTLLEHTLVLAGDVVTAGSTSQGWPAKTVREYASSLLARSRKAEVGVLAALGGDLAGPASNGQRPVNELSSLLDDANDLYA